MNNFIPVLFTLFLIIAQNIFSQEIDLNQGRQLFVYPDIIDSTTLEYTDHFPQYYDLNPVLKADKEWERNSNGDPYAAPFSGGVWYDEVDKKYKMWYSAGGEKTHGLITCYAESSDGKNWVKPTLNVVPGTNIVDTTEHDCVSVLLDKHETDPKKRYKMFIVQFNSGTSVSMRLKYSSDGIHWSKAVAQSGEIYDRSAAYYDPFSEKYVLSLKTLNGIHRRSRNFLSNENSEILVSLAHRTFNKTDDKYIRYWFNASMDDPRNPEFPEIDPQIYNHEAMPYEGLMLGYFTVWQGPENDVADGLNIQKRNEVLIGWSKNGFDWNRENKAPYLSVGKNGDWNEGNVQSTNGNPLIVGDSLYFYVSGRYNNPEWDSNFSTGLATLRRDGFASMLAGKKEGQLVTEELSFDGKYLFVNADVKKGKLLVEVLDEKGEPIDGYTKIDSQVLSKKDSTKYLMHWKNHHDLSDLAGKTIKLKFYLTKGDLYSFWISPWETGESRGYTAGGGPGLNPKGIDVPLK